MDQRQNGVQIISFDCYNTIVDVSVVDVFDSIWEGWQNLRASFMCLPFGPSFMTYFSLLVHLHFQFNFGGNIF